jgi:hypothetical protein
MNQPASTIPNPSRRRVDGVKFDLPGECVMGKGASEQKANLAAMLHAMETVIASKVPIAGKLIFTCCLSGETGKHDAIKSVVEGSGVRADMAVLGGTGLKITLGNRGRIDVFVTVRGSPCHSSRPWDGSTDHRRDRGHPPSAGKVKIDKGGSQLGKQSSPSITSSFRSRPYVQDRCGPSRPPPVAGDDPPRSPRSNGWRKRSSRSRTRQQASVDVRLGPFMYLAGDDGVADRARDPARQVTGKPVETITSPRRRRGYLNHVGIWRPRTSAPAASMPPPADMARSSAPRTRAGLCVHDDYLAERGLVAGVPPASGPVSARIFFHIIWFC